ncbi:MAG: SUF system Fe-S cluster assembly regulator [Gammaproteobacteria bacterium]|nr:SUF system Fe-S cluster assembly regulator [Gammaproteobacteria bacterium]
MLRISKLTDYSTVILSEMARQKSQSFTSSELALATSISQPTVSKVLKLLGKSSLVISSRGVNGGYRLADNPEHLSVARIINAMEGPIGITECCTTSDTCEQYGQCHISDNWGVINRAIENTLNTISLADLVSPAESLVNMASITQQKPEAQTSHRTESKESIELT